MKFTLLTNFINTGIFSTSSCLSLCQPVYMNHIICSDLFFSFFFFLGSSTFPGINFLRILSLVSLLAVIIGSGSFCLPIFSYFTFSQIDPYQFAEDMSAGRNLALGRCACCSLSASSSAYQFVHLSI